MIVASSQKRVNPIDSRHFYWYKALGITVSTERIDIAVYIIRTADGGIRTLFFAPNDNISLDLDEGESVITREKIEDKRAFKLYNMLSPFLRSLGWWDALHMLLERVFALGARFEHDRRNGHAERAGLSAVPDDIA